MLFRSVDGMFPLYDGHQRVSAWLTVKTPDFEVLALQSNRPLTEDERREVAVLLHTATGSWNWDALSGWSAADLREWGMDKDTLSGWKSDTKELTELLNSEQAESADAEPQIDRAAELLEKWQVQTGDLWQIGEHRLLCGDSTKREDVERVMGGERADLNFSDPPYGVERDEGFEGFGGFGGFGKPIARRKYSDDWDSERPNKEQFDFMLTCAENSIFWGGNYYADILPQSTHWIVWDKNNTMPTFGDCELAWTSFERKSVKKYEITYNGLIGKEKERFHPTQKPIKLYEACLSDYSKDRELIIDFYAGSGTTLVACQNLGRKCRAIEISPAYCSVILERMSTAFPQLEIKRM